MSEIVYGGKHSFFDKKYFDSQTIGKYRWHIVGIGACMALSLCDVLTTAIALSDRMIQANGGNPMFYEANPIMAGIVSSVPMALLAKLTVLGLIIMAAYLLRKNGFMSYMPYIIVGGMYALVVVHNIDLLLPLL